ncbi:MAG TPA: hypothetical protein VHF50_07840 [Solirubrobacterales bacterium]|nr:hypothetical protein [Solirubrobacterales bacterium]
MEQRVRRYREHYEDRDDLTGVQLLLEALATAIKEAQVRVVDELRKVGEQGYEPAQTTSIVQSMTRAIERSVGTGLEAISREPGRDFEQLIGPIVGLVREMEPEIEIIFRPSGQVRYSLGKSILQRLINNLEGRRNPLAKRLSAFPTLVELRYPMAEEGNVLQHLVLMHELAHLRLRRSDGEGPSLAEEHHEKAFEQWRRAKLKSVNATAGGDETSPDPQVVDEVAEEVADAHLLTSNWFTELACDLLALRLAGPAYFLALREHAALRPWFYAEGSAPQRTHPHLAWRLSLVSEEVGRLLPVRDGSDRRNEMWEVLEDFRAGVPDWRPRVPVHHVRIVTRALGTLAKKIDAVLGDSAFRVEKLDKDLDVVWGKLDTGIPPAEAIGGRTGAERGDGTWVRGRDWSSPIDWRSIINVAYFKWHADLRKRESPPKLLAGWSARSRERNALCAQLRGSLELADLLVRAQALREELSAFGMEAEHALG